MISSSIFASSKTLDLLNMGKDFESKNQTVHALSAYYDAIECAESSDFRHMAYESFSELAKIVKNGNPAAGDYSDDFDMYDGWESLLIEYENLWLENSPIEVKYGELERFSADYEARTYTYKCPVYDEWNYKFSLIKEILVTGYKKSRKSYWNSLPEKYFESNYSIRDLNEKGVVDYWGSNYNLATNEINCFGFEIQIVDSETNEVLVESLSFNISGKEKYFLIPNISRARAKIIDGKKYRIVVLKSYLKEYKKYSIYHELEGKDVGLIYYNHFDFSPVGQNNENISWLKLYDDLRLVHIEGYLHTFDISQIEVTQKLYKKIMGEYSRGGSFSFEDKPVNYISWNDAVYFCNKLSEYYGLKPVYTITKNGSGKINVAMNNEANGFRLPYTEEWRYAANGKLNEIPEQHWDDPNADNPPKYRLFAGAGLDNLDSIAWYCDNSGGTTHNGGTKAPNGFDLYDMNGNVAEWCWDTNGDSAYHNILGGSYKDSWNWLDFGGRTLSSWADKGSKDIGFRVVKNCE